MYLFQEMYQQWEIANVDFKKDVQRKWLVLLDCYVGELHRFIAKHNDKLSREYRDYVRKLSADTNALIDEQQASMAIGRGAIVNDELIYKLFKIAFADK
jgi:hypothetical protein